MANPEFKYAPMFQLGPDKTEYRLLTKEGVSVGEFEGKEILKVTPEALTRLAQEAFHDVEFKLRREHNLQVAAILNDPEASENDKYVALQFLRNAETAVKGVLPFCQDTGTAIIHGEKGQQVWTGFEDEEALSLGVYNTFTQDNLRYSQNAPLNMYDEVNTKCNLPAQIDIEAVEGAEYRFVMVAKGGGSANKTYFYPMTKATIQNEGTLLPFLVEKMKTLGTAACPPYHIAFVIGGTSAEKNLLTVKLASIKYYDNLPTTGDETGRAFRDIDLEEKLLVEAQKIGMGAQFGGKYLAHDIRVIRLPRHGASCPIGMGVSCSAPLRAHGASARRRCAGHSPRWGVHWGEHCRLREYFACRCRGWRFGRGTRWLAWHGGQNCRSHGGGDGTIGCRPLSHRGGDGRKHLPRLL